MNNKHKIGIVVSHPIQHFCPQYVSFAENRSIHLKVFFGSALGHKKYIDKNFKEEIAWGNLCLDKFDHVFLNGDAVIQPGKNLDAKNLEKELNTFQPDLLIVYGYFQKLQKRARRWGLQHRIPLAYISDAEGRQHRSVLKEYLKSFMLQRYFRPLSYFLTVGDANEAYYHNYGVPAAKMLRMHFPIDIRQYQDSFSNKGELRNNIRTEYGIGRDEVIITVVGKLSSWKNQDHIIDAMQILEKRGLITHLFILGSGEMKTEWENKAALLQQSKVHFPGFVSIEQLPAYYAATDIYVHPASVEPHSIAVSEAIYMGCPVIVSDRCGSYGENDDVQEGKNGYVFEFGNTRQLAQKMQILIEDKEQREQFGNYSHNTAVGFQSNAHYKMLEKLIDGLKFVKGE